MEAFLFAALIVFVAASLQSSTGFGFSIIATPLLLLVYEPRMAIQLNIILSLVVSTAMWPRIRAEIDRPMLRRLIKSGLLGVPLGGVLFTYLDPQVLKLAIGILVLVVVGFLAAKFTFVASRRGERIAGLFSGAFAASLGAPGPPMLIYFAGTTLDKAVIRSTSLAFFLFAYGGALIAQVAMTSTDRGVWLGALALVPAVAVGTLAGQRLFGLIDQRLFSRVINVILAITGVYLLVASL